MLRVVAFVQYGIVNARNWRQASLEQKMPGYLNDAAVALAHFAAKAMNVARSAQKKAATSVRTAGPLANRMRPHLVLATDWVRRQQHDLQTIKVHREAVEQWARANASVLGWTKRPRSGSLEHIEATLVSVTAAIRQQNNRNTRRFVSLVFGKLGGALTVGGITGLVSTYGLASTGTAIAALHGAAAQTALLYWFGSVVGLGVAAGGLMLTGIGIVAGVLLSVLTVWVFLGRPRQVEKLQEHETKVIDACAVLINAVQAQIATDQKPQPAEMRLFALQALIPLAAEIDRHWDSRALEENGATRECRPFTRTLAWYHRRKLDRARKEIGRIAMATLSQPVRAE